MYSTILARASGGSCGDINMRLMTVAERPEHLCWPFRTVQVVLREIPRALACSSSVMNPAVMRASPSSLILDDCRAFISEIMLDTHATEHSRRSDKRHSRLSAAA